MKGETNAWLKQGDTLVKKGDTQGAIVGYRRPCQQRAECRSASVGRYRYYGQLASSVHC